MKTDQKINLTASKIALIYALISVAWILFSDQLLAATASTVETIGNGRRWCTRMTSILRSLHGSTPSVPVGPMKSNIVFSSGMALTDGT